MQAIYGMQIIVNDVRYQKIKLSEKVVVSDSFRDEINQYLLDNFGYRYVLEDGQTIVSSDKSQVLMNPNTKKQLDLAIGQLNASFGKSASVR